MNDHPDGASRWIARLLMARALLCQHDCRTQPCALGLGRHGGVALLGRDQSRPRSVCTPVADCAARLPGERQPGPPVLGALDAGLSFSLQPCLHSRLPPREPLRHGHRHVQGLHLRVQQLAFHRHGLVAEQQLQRGKAALLEQPGMSHDRL